MGNTSQGTKLNNLNVLITDIKFHLLLQISDDKINLLIHTNIYHCKLEFLVSRAGTIIQRSTITLGNKSLELQGISSHFSLHLDLTPRGFTSISLHLHLNPPKVTRDRLPRVTHSPLKCENYIEVTLGVGFPS
jgi:hypothetical protein